MKDNLGTILADIRRKVRASQKDIADGIISPNFMCKVERGEKELDYVVMETLFERLGKCADKIEKGITNGDYQLIRLRDEIADCISKNEPELANTRLEEYVTWADMKNNVHRQYHQAIKAMIQYLENRDAKFCLTELIKALQITHIEWNSNGYMYLCNQEIQIFYLIAFMKIKLGELQEVENKLKTGSVWLLQHYSDGEELVKVYPHAMWLLAKVYFLQNRIDKSFVTIQNAKECLCQNGSFMPMYNLLKLEAECLQLLDKKTIL